MKNIASLLLISGLLIFSFAERESFSDWNVDKDPFDGLEDEDENIIPKLRRMNAQNFEPLLAEMEKEEILLKFQALLNQEIDLRDITNPRSEPKTLVEEYFFILEY